MTKKLYLGPGNRPRYSGGGGIGRGGNGGGGGGAGGRGDSSNLRLYLSGEIKTLTIQPFVKKSVVPLIQYNFKNDRCI